MRITLVLGAGATLAQAELFHSVRRQDRNPPLDYTFFEKVRALQLGVPAQLRDYARRVPPVDPFEKGARPLRMEELFKDIYYDFQDTPGNLNIRRAYTQLVELYLRVIRETTNWVCEHPGTGGPVGRLLAAAADVAERVSVITFNQDLVIENEIFKRRRLRHRWCIEQGYGLLSDELAYTTPPRGVTAFPEHSDECDHDRGIFIHKLHGSVNWYIRIGGEAPTARQLSGQGPAPEVYASRRRTAPAHLTQHIERAGPGRRTYNTWPVVVPPVYAKDPLIKAFVASPWEEARLQLAAAEAIVFFGYSLPQTDVQAERLFQRALRANNDTTVAIINPSLAAASRFASLMRSQPLIRYPSVDAFLERGAQFILARR